MTPNQISLLLEIVSFFCVTIDLYGKERMAKLGDRLHQFFIRFRRLESSKLFWWKIRDLANGDRIGVKFSRTPPFVFREAKEEIHDWFSWLLVLIFVPMLIWFLPLSWRLVNQISWLAGENLINLLLRPVSAYIIAGSISMFLTWAGLLIVGVIATIGEFLANIVIRFSIFLLDRMKLEGVLLAVGAVIFLASKIIAITLE